MHVYMCIYTHICVYICENEEREIFTCVDIYTYPRTHRSRNTHKPQIPYPTHWSSNSHSTNVSLCLSLYICIYIYRERERERERGRDTHTRHARDGRRLRFSAMLFLHCLRRAGTFPRLDEKAQKHCEKKQNQWAGCVMSYIISHTISGHLMTKLMLVSVRVAHHIARFVLPLCATGCTDRA